MAAICDLQVFDHFHPIFQVVNIIPRPRLHNLVKMYGEAAVIFSRDIITFFLVNNGYLKVYSLEPDFEVIRPLQVLLLRPFKGAIIPFLRRAAAGF